MGSFQQISLGAVCLVAAFMFGNYVNNHPNSTEVANDLQPAPLIESSTSFLQPGKTIQRPAPMVAMRDTNVSRAPMMGGQQTNSFGGRAPAMFADSAPAIQQKLLPPPSQLDRAVAAPVADANSAHRLPTTPVTIPNVVGNGLKHEIEMPDFSKLAKEFRNTPLELPSINPVIPPANRIDTRTYADQSKRTVGGKANLEFSGNGNRQFSGSVANNRIPNPRGHLQSAPHSAHFSPMEPKAAQPAFGNSANTIATEFSDEDFAPQLKDRFEFKSRQQADSQTNQLVNNQLPRETESARSDQRHQWGPVETSGLSVLESEKSAASQQTNVRVANSFADSALAQPTQSIEGRPVVSAAKPVIPFGLTDEAKSRLVAVQRGSGEISLGTTQFTQHVTVAGDTLQNLSTRFYGRPDFYLDIYVANQKLLRSPANLPTGLTLRIPLYK